MPIADIGQTGAFKPLGDLCRLRDRAIFMKKVRRRVIYLTYEAQHGQYAIRNFNSAAQCLRHVKGQGSNERETTLCNADGSGLSLSNYSSSNICRIREN